MIEVVVASVLLQVALLGVLGTLVRATELRSEAERLEHTVAVAESVLDSLLGGDSVATDGAASRESVRLTWTRTGRYVRLMAQGPNEARVVLTGWGDS